MPPRTPSNDAPADPARISSARVLAIAAIAGAATLVVELAAVRLLAPWFGASAGVWTNVIGVILLALAAGYLAGARLAARPRPARALALVLLFSGLFAAWLPALAGPVCGLFLPDGLSLHQAAGLWLWGSLAAALLLFLPPAALLGCVGPLAVEILQVRRSLHAGTAGGLVLCASTLGSLAGTFATTHLLLPTFGLTASFVGAGLVLVACGGLAWVDARGSGTSRAVGAAALLGTLIAVAGSRLERPPLPPGMTLVEQTESRYQSLRVVEDATFDVPLRLLQVNEGLDSFQSIWSPQTGLLGPGFYYDYFALPAWLAGASGPWRTLVLGLGAGTTFRVLEGALPQDVTLEAWGVELDAEIVDLGHRWFELPEGDPHRVVLAGQDARLAQHSLPGDYHLVVLDAYANQVEIPAHLSSLEFFGEVREHLAVDGWLAVNAGGFGADDPVVAALARTIAEVFDECLALRVPRARNWVLIARRGGSLPRPDAEGRARGPGWEITGEVPAALLTPLTLPGSISHWVAGQPSSAEILTDDRNPMDVLQRRSLARGRERLDGTP